VNGELSVFFAFTRHKATSAAAIGEGAVEISDSLRRGHCCVCCGWWLRFSGWNWRRSTGFRDNQGFDLKLYHRVRSLATLLKP